MADQVSGNAILKAVDILINKRIDDLDLDKTVIGTVVRAISPEKDGCHEVKYGGGSFQAYSQNGVGYMPNTTVYVQIPQNDFSKRKMILGPASSTAVGNNLQIASAITNNYMPIGRSLLTLIDEDKAESGFGLNSYSSNTIIENGKTREKAYQDAVILYSRANRNLKSTDPNANKYDINILNLENYLKQAKAIMLQADFRTTLTSEQQIQHGAEYGLVFDLAFKETQTTYPTQGAMLEGLGGNLVGNAITNAGATYKISIVDYKKQVDLIFASATSYNTIAYPTIAVMQQTIASIQDKVFALIQNNTDSLTSQERDIFTKYYYMLNDLSTTPVQTYENLYRIWSAWNNYSLLDSNKDKSPTKIVSYVLNSSRMTGNPFNFTQWVTQNSTYSIDIENFQYIDSIYFYCKGFIDNETKWKWIDKNRYPIEDYSSYTGAPAATKAKHGKDIWLRDLSFFVLQEIESQYGEYKLKTSIDPDAVFKTLDKEDTRVCLATALYKEYTGINDDCEFYWFKKDSRVTSSQHEDWNLYGGTGWAWLNRYDTSFRHDIKASENRAYENEYMVAAVYKNAAEGTIVLKTQFIVYNEMCRWNLSLESDIGVSFSFGAGTPQLTCKIEGREENFQTDNELRAKNDNAFKFYWSCRTSDGQTLELNHTYEEIEQLYKISLDAIERQALKSQMYRYDGVSYPKGINGNKLIYPVKNVLNASSITFYCQVYTTDTFLEGNPVEDSSYWYSIGSTELTIENKGVAAISEYRVTFDGGDQVFQYTESGVAPTIVDTISPTDFRHTDPLEIQEVRPHLIAPTGIEVDEGLYSVSWRYPRENTLIISDIIFEEDPVTKLPNLVNSRTATFDIAPSYDYSCTDNQLECVINYAGEVYTKKTEFYFGKIGDNGTNGTDFVSKITVANDRANVLDNQPLTLYINTNNAADLASYTYAWNIGQDPLLEAKLYNRATEITSPFTHISWKILGGTKNSFYFDFDNENEKQINLTIITPDMGDYEKNKSTYLYHNQIIQVSITYEGKSYYATYPICVVTGQQKDVEELKKFGISFSYKDMLKQILYNSDGRRPLYNKNQGVKLNGITGHYVMWNRDGGLHKYKTENNILATQPLNDPYKTRIPFYLLADKDTVFDSNTDNFSEDISTYSNPEIAGVGIDQIWIQPKEEYDGSSTDNNVIASVYLSQSVLSQIDVWNEAKIQAEENYKQTIALIDKSVDSTTKDYKISRRQLENNWDAKIDESTQEIEPATSVQTEWYTETLHYIDSIEQIISMSQDEGNDAYSLAVGIEEYLHWLRGTTLDSNEYQSEDFRKKLSEIIAKYYNLGQKLLAALDAYQADEIPEDFKNAYTSYLEYLTQYYNAAIANQVYYKALLENFITEDDTIDEELEINGITASTCYQAIEYANRVVERLGSIKDSCFIRNIFDILTNWNLEKIEQDTENTQEIYSKACETAVQEYQQSEYYLELTKLQQDKEKALSDKDQQYQDLMTAAENSKEIALETYNTRIEQLNNQITDAERTNKVEIIVPIYIALNTFGLASLNAWDGNSVTINEDESGAYIMAPQIGAGVKNSANQFTGIVMGKVGTYADSFSDISDEDDEKDVLDADGNKVGLVGYSEGRESIFLNSVNGSATFGLPDLNSTYTEGRIELRPGGVSRIGGWNLGRRSLFYALHPVGNGYQVLKDLGPKYSDKAAAEHEKDIPHEDRGILLSAGTSPYISVKGRPLTVGTGGSYDVDNTLGNSPLRTGNSLELQLDPNVPSIFTIFRHFQDESGYQREPLVGIDSAGRFYSNTLKDQETALTMNYVAAFGKDSASHEHAGLSVEYGDQQLYKIFLRIGAGLVTETYEKYETEVDKLNAIKRNQEQNEIDLEEAIAELAEAESAKTNYSTNLANAKTAMDAAVSDRDTVLASYNALEEQLETRYNPEILELFQEYAEKSSELEELQQQDPEEIQDLMEAQNLRVSNLESEQQTLNDIFDIYEEYFNNKDRIQEDEELISNSDDITIQEDKDDLPLIQEKDQLLLDIANLDFDVEIYQDIIDSTKEQLDDLPYIDPDADEDGLTDEEKNIKQQRAELQETINTNQSSLQSAETERQTKNERVQQINDLVHERNADITASELQISITRREGDISDIQDEIEELEKTVSEQESVLKQRISSYSSSIDTQDLNEAYDALSEIFENNNSTILQLNTQIEQEEFLLSTLTSDIENLSARLQEISDSLATAGVNEQQYQTYITQLQKLEDDLDAAEDKADQATSQYEWLVEQKDYLDSNIEQANQEKDRLEQIKTSLAADYAAQETLKNKAWAAYQKAEQNYNNGSDKVTEDSRVYLSGSPYTDEYVRPMSFHGQEFSFFAKEGPGKNTSGSSSSKFLLNSNQVYLGNPDTALEMKTSGNGINGTTWTNTKSDINFDFTGRTFETKATTKNNVLTSDWMTDAKKSIGLYSGKTINGYAFDTLELGVTSNTKYTTLADGDMRLKMDRSTGIILGQVNLTAEPSANNVGYLKIGKGQSYSRLQSGGTLRLGAGAKSTYIDLIASGGSGTSIHPSNTDYITHVVTSKRSRYWNIRPGVHVQGESQITGRLTVLTGTEKNGLIVKSGGITLGGGNLQLTSANNPAIIISNKIQRVSGMTDDQDNYSFTYAKASKAMVTNPGGLQSFYKYKITKNFKVQNATTRHNAKKGDKTVTLSATSVEGLFADTAKILANHGAMIDSHVHTFNKRITVKVSNGNPGASIKSNIGSGSNAVITVHAKATADMSGVSAQVNQKTAKVSISYKTYKKASTSDWYYKVENGGSPKFYPISGTYYYEGPVSTHTYLVGGSYDGIKVTGLTGVTATVTGTATAKVKPGTWTVTLQGKSSAAK